MPVQSQKRLSDLEMVLSKDTPNKSTHQINSVLLSAHAFKSGVQLWLITDYQHSSWTAIIDWYTNFQITKNRMKKTTKKQTTLNLQAASLTKEQKHNLPLLIGSSSLLPCQQLLELPYTKNWLDEAYSLWQSLNSPSLRIFVPAPINISKAQEYWKKSPAQFIVEPNRKH